MYDQDLPRFLWTKASRNVFCIQNITPHEYGKKILLKKNSLEKNPQVGHLKIFGCPIYIHVPKDKTRNLDSSRKKGIFVGYCE